jgi:predicted PurR-regulated permease PerM
MENKLFVRFMIFLTLGLVTWLFLPFLKSFFIAFLLAIVVFPLYQAVEAKIRRIERLSSMASVISAGIVTLGLSLILFVPIAIFLYYLFDQPANVVGTLRALSDQIDTITNYIPDFLGWMKEPLDNLILLGKAHKDEIIATLATWLGNGLQTFMVMLAEMAMIVVFFFFLSWYGRSMLLFLLPIVPLSRTLKRGFFSDMMTTTAVVFYSLGGVMLAQGLAFGIFIAFFEGYNPFMLGFMTAISAVIPVVGTALIWVPVALHEYFEGNIMNALLITCLFMGDDGIFYRQYRKTVDFEFCQSKIK